MTCILTRRSPPGFTPEPVGPDLAGRLIEAASNAPDHGRLRPWRFLIFEGERRTELASILAEALAVRQPDVSADLIAKERAKPFRAPLVIAVAAAITAHPKIPEIEQVLAAGAAAQNIMLAAHALGYAAQWKTGDPAFDPNVKEALGLTKGDHIIGFLYIGKPARTS